MATVLSIQACMLLQPTAKRPFFSAQRIWDCYPGSCELGVSSLMGNFFPTMIVGPDAKWMLQPYARSGEQRMDDLASNYSRCERREGLWKLGGVEQYGGIGQDALNRSARLMREHIARKGPAMAVVQMTQSAFNFFTRMNASSPPFVLASHTLGTVRHALAVIGWSASDNSWLVQNSMGNTWGNMGLGWVKGPLQAEWYALQLLSLESDVPLLNNLATPSPARPILPTVKEEVDDLMIFWLTLLSMAMLAALVCTFA
jgi:hypothetical protein